MSSSALTDSSGMRCFSAAQSPKSINLQRSEQKGLNLFSVVHVPVVLQWGQQIVFMFMCSRPAKKVSYQHVVRDVYIYPAKKSEYLKNAVLH